MLKTNKVLIATMVLASIMSCKPNETEKKEIELKASGEHKVIVASEIKWGMLNPLRGDASPKAADLYGDRTKDTATGMLVKFEPGFSSPPHIHNVTYKGIVINGLMHNDDPTAEKMWMPKGSFWTQPAGENHITAANDNENMAYIEIDSGPYLVLSSDEAFDNGERSVNIDKTNIIWLNKKDVNWVENSNAKIAFLWGDVNNNNGTFLKLPANFNGFIKDNNAFKAVIIDGELSYDSKGNIKKLTEGSFFSSESDVVHGVSTGNKETLIYVKNIGDYSVISK